jgi:hypothetical protein
MSTKSIHDEAEAALAALQDVAVAADRRLAEIREEEGKLKGKQDSILRGAALAQRHVIDQREVLAEEESQLANPLGTTTADKPESTQPPASSEEEVDEDEPTPVRRRVPTPAPEPTQEQHRCCHEHETVVHDRPVRVINVWGVRNWSVLQWLLAVLGLIVFLAISVNTTGVFDDVNTDWLHDTLVMLWVVLMSVFGFFAGGLIGALIDERHSSHQVTT